MRSTSTVRRPVPRHRTLAVLGITAVALTSPVAVPAAQAAPARAKPKPDVDKLHDQLEQLSEQYNGLKVKLAETRRAAKVADGIARQQERSLEAVRRDIARVAATTYINGETDPTQRMFATSDPQSLLDQASTLKFFATQNGTRVSALMQAVQGARRARLQAQERKKQVETLRANLAKKRDAAAKLYDKAKGQLDTQTPKTGKKPGNAPSVPGSGKGAQALRYALAQLGVPYSWGGGNASGPSYGVAQGANIKGFDCSGLTLYAYARVGINLPHYTGAQFNAGTRVTESQLQPGDLVFFYSDLHHMGMYVGNGKMVHAPQTGDVVKISPMAGRPFAGGVRLS
ncbi:C40 family peptidase [Actinomadura oligospora]|uniref:C40 family peptidase n=1 Tax=Actinomadura oligospora TaxID=111804 RepID=UPI0004B8B10B|nr:NlpC/P60 family protein [Actinomadura oligospora]